MQRLYGVVLGALLGFAAVAGLLWLDRTIFPWPAADWSDSVSLAAMVEAAPMTAKVMAVGGWFLGALIGGLVAVRIGAWPAAGWVVAALVALAGIGGFLLVPQPLWMAVAAVAAPFAAGICVAGASGPA